MNRNSALNSNLIVIIVPLAMVITLVLLADSALFSQHPSVLSVGITIDLVLSSYAQKLCMEGLGSVSF